MRGCIRLAVVGWLVAAALAAKSLAAEAVTPLHKNRSHLEQVNARAARLLELDLDARRQFAREHPNVLPDAHLVLPKPHVAAFDWCNLNKVSEAHRQRNQDCWANAATEALECSYLIRNNDRIELSVQPVLDHLRLGARHVEGRSSLAAEFFLKTGTTLSRDYPYTGKPAEPRHLPLPYRAMAWGYVSTNGNTATVEQLKEALLHYGPIAVSVLATKKFHAYEGGLFVEHDLPEEDRLKTNHVVLLTGWDNTMGRHGAWKVKNTWGTGWGEQGFMWIAFGSNNIGEHAVWVRAASVYYSLPAAFEELVPGAQPLPRAGYRAK